jgi:hemolysin activation/secretion protein
MNLLPLHVKFNVWIIVVVLSISVLCISPCLLAQAATDHEGRGEPAPTFDIKTFTVEGNTLLTAEKIEDILNPYRGKKKTADDVEKARDSLEKFYHELGYPAVLVNLPEQTVEGGNIRLQVIESTIGNVRVTGNRYYTREKILRDLPSLSPGKILYLPDAQSELTRVNRGQDLKVTPLLAPGKELGTTDVELKVEDKLPLHGNLELNNMSTYDKPISA